MSEQKITVNVPQGQGQVEIVHRTGAAEKLLDPKPPVRISLAGVIGVVGEFLGKRIDQPGQICQKRCHILVDREKICITLVTSEDDDYLRGTVTGTLEFHPKFIEFGINTGKVWTPPELGLFFKMNRAFFPDKSANMKLVTDLMNFSATVNNKIDRTVKENGDRTDNFAQVVNSNLPPSFTLSIPIFKGIPPEVLEVETFAKVNGREVSFILLSPGANQILEEIRDAAIDSELNRIISIAPDIAIIEQ